MYRSTRLVCLTLFVCSIPFCLLSQDRAHELAAKATAQKAASCPAAGMTLQQCHEQFPDGCENTAHPAYDPYLDFLKDQDPSPTPRAAQAPKATAKELKSATKELKAADFAKLESALPKGLEKTNHASFATQLADLGEGNMHSVVGYLYFAFDTGKGSGTKTPLGETCNCKLTDPDTFDYHIGLGFDPTLAEKARSTPPKLYYATFMELEKDSFVAEMTPYIRQQHPKWTLDRLAAHRGELVKVVGQLMVDNHHFNAHDDCRFPGAQSACWRSTVWEVHPITQFYLCKQGRKCTASSPERDWTSLDDAP